MLNGSVDGRGYKRFMVLEGQYVYRTLPTPGLFPVVIDAAGQRVISTTPATRRQIDDAKRQLHQLVMDGVTLVTAEGRYIIRNLAAQNPGTDNPLIAYLAVTGDPVEGNATYGPDLDVTRLADVLPPVPPYLRPIADAELRIPADEAAARRAIFSMRATTGSTC